MPIHRLLKALTPVGAIVLGSLWGSTLWAQTPPNPQDVVAEKMPFNIPYGTPIGLDKAEQVLNTSIAQANQRDWKMVCTVVDPSGEMVSFKRMDNAQIASISISMHKARTAARFRRETKAFEIAIQTNPYVSTLDDVIASRGGIPLVDDGKLIGAVGCSGGSGAQDELVAKAGAALINRP
jgi:glc operon protein GlcG